MGEALLIKFGGEVANPYEGIDVVPGYAAILLTVYDSDGNTMQGMECNFWGYKTTTNARGQALYSSNSTDTIRIWANNLCTDANIRYIDQANMYMDINPTNYNGNNYFNKVLPISITLNRINYYQRGTYYSNSSNNVYLSFRVTNNIVNMYLVGGGGGGIGCIDNGLGYESGITSLDLLNQFIETAYRNYGDVNIAYIKQNTSYLYRNNINGNYKFYSPVNNTIGGHGGGGGETIFIPKITDAKNIRIGNIILGTGGSEGNIRQNVNIGGYGTYLNRVIYTQNGNTGGTSSITGYNISVSAIGGSGATPFNPGSGGISSTAIYYDGIRYPGMDGGYRGQNSTSSYANARCGGGGGGWNPATNTYGISINGGCSGDSYNSSIPEGNAVLTYTANNNVSMFWIRSGIGKGIERPVYTGGGGGGTGIGTRIYNINLSNDYFYICTGMSGTLGNIYFEME